MVTEIEELNFLFYLIFINLNLNLVTFTNLITRKPLSVFKQLKYINLVINYKFFKVKTQINYFQ